MKLLLFLILCFFSCKNDPTQSGTPDTDDINNNEEKRFYFVHSYYVNCSDHNNISAICNYGNKFTCAVEKNNILGVQFHPEFLSRPGKPHPLFNDFVRAASKTIVEGTQYPLNGATKS